MPNKYRGISIETVQPDSQRHQSQPRYVKDIQANPNDSYLICGANGVGKTFLLWALYAHAVKQDRRTVACSLTELLDEYKAAMRSMEREEEVKVRITAADLRQNQTPYSIFLDEIDKARPTEYAGEQLFAILDAAYSFGHQVVATTNLNVSDLIEFWDRADERYGRSIVRRLTDERNVLEMF
jgi:DNA replication protein DnaC